MGKERQQIKNFSKKEILIIASILEKEACANERKKYQELYNRLKKYAFTNGPTTIYGLKNFSGDLKKRFRDSSLYNTYMHKGLPQVNF